MRKLAVLTLLIILSAAIPLSSAQAQDYSYQVTDMDVNAFWNEDGTLSVDYVITFQNDPNGHPIEFVDLGLPNNNYDVTSISADANGQPLGIDASDYQGQGSGVAIAMGSQTIPPGQSGTVHAFIGTIRGVLYEDELEDEYASAVFAPAQFLSSTTHGTTNMTVTFHLPPGLEPEQPRWHESPSGWSEEPEAGFDENGRITYTWRNPSAEVWETHELGASFPLSFVPESAIVRPNPFAWIGNINFGFCIPLFCFGFFAVLSVLGAIGGRRRKMQYLPPKISVEGHGIKRGLTAVEAAVLMEQPMDKILTMVLFGVIKKNAAKVVNRDPLEVEPLPDLPENLWDYEKDFLNAFQEKRGPARERAMQTAMVSLIKVLSTKMKGFSRKETIDYYKDIMDKAWAQVEAADTPEVKSQKYDEYMEWTMLDRNWNDRTRDVFRSGPVFVPVWFPRYDPSFGGAGGTTVSTGIPRGTSGGGGGGPSLPVLPGADFAASVVGGAQSFASGVVGNLNDFTSRVTNVTNPVPKTTSSGGYRGGGGGGRSCACACACAGCACACAGGGR